MNVTQRVVAAIQNAVRAAEADNPSLYPYLRDFGNLLDPDGQHVDNSETGEAIFGPWQVATIDQLGARGALLLTTMGPACVGPTSIEETHEQSAAPTRRQ